MLGILAVSPQYPSCFYVKGRRIDLVSTKLSAGGTMICSLQANLLQDSLVRHVLKQLCLQY